MYSSQPTTENRRVFLAAGPRSKKPATSIVVNFLKTLTRQEKPPGQNTLHVGAAVSCCAISLTNHVSTRQDKHSEEKIVQDIMKHAEQRLNCTVAGGSTVK